MAVKAPRTRHDSKKDPEYSMNPAYNMNMKKSCTQHGSEGDPAHSMAVRKTLHMAPGKYHDALQSNRGATDEETPRGPDGCSLARTFPRSYKEALGTRQELEAAKIGSGSRVEQGGD